MADMPYALTPAASNRAVALSSGPRDPYNDGFVSLHEAEPVSVLARQALDHWHAIRGDALVPYRRALDPVDIPHLLANAELIDVLEQARDFRYRLIGDEIDRISRHYYVGKRVSEIPSQRPPSMIHSLYVETVKRAQPVCARLPYVGDDPFIDHVEAVITPLTEDGRAIEMLWGTVVPIAAER